MKLKSDRKADVTAILSLFLWCEEVYVFFEQTTRKLISFLAVT